MDRNIFKELRLVYRDLPEADRRALRDLGFNEDVEGGAEISTERRKEYERIERLLDPELKKFLLEEQYRIEDFEHLKELVGFSKESEYVEKEVERRTKLLQLDKEYGELIDKGTGLIEAKKKSIQELENTTITALKTEIEALKGVPAKSSEHQAKVNELRLKEAELLKAKKELETLEKRIPQIQKQKEELTLLEPKLKEKDKELLKRNLYHHKRLFDIGTFVKKLGTDTDFFNKGEIPSLKKVTQNNPYVKFLVTSEMPWYARHFHGIETSPGKLTLKFADRLSVFSDPTAIYATISSTLDMIEKEDDGEISKEELKTHLATVSEPLKKIILDNKGDKPEEIFNLYKSKVGVKVIIPEEYTFEGYEYVALVWPRISNIVSHELGKAGVNPKMLNYALKNPTEFYALNEFVFDLAKNFRTGKINEGLLLKAVEELKTAERNKYIELMMGKDRVFDMSRKSIDDLKLLRKHTREKYKDNVNAVEPSDAMKYFEYGKWEVNILRRENKINAITWDPVSSKMSLAEMSIQWEQLGIDVNAYPYNNILNQLAKASDTEYLNKHANSLWTIFKNPEKNESKIRNADPEFWQAWLMFKHIQQFMILQDERQKASDKNISKLGRSAPGDAVTDFLKSNVGKLTDAVRDRDYGTIAVYAAGVASIIHLIRRNKDGTVGKFVKDYGPWVIAGYFGLKAAEAAGYPVFKKMGIEKEWEELKGTNLMQWVNQAGLDKVHADVYVQSSKLKLSELYRYYKESHIDSNTEVPGFIDPLLFEDWNDQFEGLAGDVTLRRKQNKEYERIGTQLFLITHGMKKIYELSLMTHGDAKVNKLLGVSFEEAISRPVFANSTVEDFLGALANFSQPEKVGMDEYSVLTNRFKALFPEDMNFSIGTLVPLSEGDEAGFGTKMMGLPVVIQKKGSEYVIYSREKFLKGERTPLATISEDKVSNEEASMLKDNIEHEIKDTYQRLRQSRPDLPDFDQVKWDEGRWVFTRNIDNPNDSNRGQIYTAWGLVSTGSEKFEIAFNDKGVLDTPPIESLETKVLDQIKRDPKFSFLHVFTGRSDLIKLENIRFEDNKGRVTLKVADLELPLFYDFRAQTVNLEDGAKNQEIKAERFFEEYSKGLLNWESKNEGLLRTRIAEANEGLWKHLKAKASGDSIAHLFDGAVPERQTEVLLRSAKYELAQRMKQQFRNFQTKGALFEKSNSFGELQTKMMEGFDANLRMALDNMTSFQAKHESWDTESFDRGVMQPIRIAAGTSEISGYNKRLITEAMFDRKLDGTDLYNSDFFEELEIRLNTYNRWAKHGGNYTYKDESGGIQSLYISIDNPHDPLSSTGNITPKHKDPAYVGWYWRAYNDYVREKVIAYNDGKILSRGKEAVPDPGSEAWDIQPFEKWAIEAKNNIGLAEINAMKPFKHENPQHDVNNVNPATGEIKKYTELELAIKEAFEEELQKISLEADTFDYELAKKRILNDILIAKETNGKWHSKIWNIANAIAGLPRKIQEEKIRENVRVYVWEPILEDKDDYFDDFSPIEDLLRNNPSILRYLP